MMTALARIAGTGLVEQILSNGAWVDATARASRIITAPATLVPLGTVSECGAECLDAFRTPNHGNSVDVMERKACCYPDRDRRPARGSEPA